MKEQIRQLCFPDRCPGCDRVLPDGFDDTGFCAECKKHITVISEHFCLKCGKLLENDSQEYCSDCRQRKHIFKEGRAVFLYRDEMKGTMYRFKYANRRCYARIFAKQAQKRWGGWVADCAPDSIVPVPLYRKKQRRRGYNQAMVWARELEKCWKLPVDGTVLTRIRDTRPQKTLGPEERRQNLRQAFRAKKELAAGRKILLVDDIYTTGSTVDEAAAALMRAGCGEVYCLCICTGRENDF